MSIFNAVIQAIVQGLTEFLPVSSSGHLSLTQHFTGVNGESALLFSIVLHLGTLVAVFIAFRKTIWALIKEAFRMLGDLFTLKFRRFKWKTMNAERRMILMILLSLLPLFVFYIFKDIFTGIASDDDIIIEGVCFLFTALMLFISDRCVKGRKEYGDVTVRDSLTIGTFQGIALLPGVSRSGSTISAGLLCGFTRETAVQFSFIMGIPAILGGSVLELKDVQASDLQIDWVPVLVGFAVAALVGLLAIQMVRWLVKSDKFKIFGIYTFLLGLATIGVGLYENLSGQTLMDMLSHMG